MSLVEPLIPPPSLADRAAALQAAGGVSLELQGGRTLTGWGVLAQLWAWWCPACSNHPPWLPFLPDPASVAGKTAALQFIHNRWLQPRPKSKKEPRTQVPHSMTGSTCCVTLSFDCTASRYLLAQE
jgi:hypothetical protein